MTVVSWQHLPITDSLAEYLRSISAPEPDFLVRLRQETAKDPMAIMQITPEQGAFLAMLIRLIGARKTLEVGVFTGYSSICVARALPPGGRLIACDISPQWTAVARRYWKQAGVEDKIELHLAPAQETMNMLLRSGQAGTFDFAFIDADKTGYDTYYELALQLLSPSGLMAVDNVLWHGKVADPAVNDADTEAIRAFNRKLRNDPRIQVCVLPIGDGLTLATRK